jgi:phosphoribosyl 1,2-cyclic phosphodiesterase
MLQFTVLASGSGGNAAVIQSQSLGVLLDCGLGPRQLAQRLAAAGLSWSHVNAALLTHTHSDHWNDRTLGHLLRRRVMLYCHAKHHADLMSLGSSFAALRDAELVRDFHADEELTLAPDLKCRPFALRHDGTATFGFRFTGAADLFGQCSALAYAADLGSWTDALVAHLLDVDLLALEFNHDVHLERMSGRGPRLIARVLGDDGHLSNHQAADLVRAILSRSTPGRLRHLVQLHLSRDCNRPQLAADVAREAFHDHAATATVHTAEQDRPLTTLHLDATGRRRPPTRRPRAKALDHPRLPGLA